MVRRNDPAETAMSVLRDAVELEVRLRGFADKTHAAYMHAMEQLTRHWRRTLIFALICRGEENDYE